MQNIETIYEKDVNKILSSQLSAYSHQLKQKGFKLLADS